MLRILALSTGAALVAAVTPAVVAEAAPAASTSAVVRAAHFSPDTPGVDVYLTAYSGGHSSLWLSDVGYGDVSSYRRIKPGPYVVSMRRHGAASSSPAALSWTLSARPGAAYTVAAVGHNADLRGIVLHDELTPPSKGTGRVRVIQAASRVPLATISAGSRTVASDAAFASTTNYATVPAGTWSVSAKNSQAAAPSTRSKVSITASGVYSLVVLDAHTRGIEVRVVRDAAGTAVAPRGSVDAGAGGTATTFTGGGVDPLGWIAAMLAIVLGALAAGRLALRHRVVR